MTRNDLPRVLAPCEHDEAKAVRCVDRSQLPPELLQKIREVLAYETAKKIVAKSLEEVRQEKMQ